MKDEWTKHRFSGGALALDLVNTVVRRSDPARAFDRLRSAADAASFAEAAARFRNEEPDGVIQFCAAAEADFHRLIELRDHIYACFAPVPADPAARQADLSLLLTASGRALEGAGPDSLLSRAVFSWMRLHGPETRGRVRACPACDWLFLDRSRNGSRIWCDMAVCGNRRKSRLNYDRRRRAARLEAAAA